MWIKKWSRIRGTARNKVCVVLPISLLFEQNLPVPNQECNGGYPHGALRSESPSALTTEENSNFQKIFPGDTARQTFQVQKRTRTIISKPGPKYGFTNKPHME